MRTRSSSNLIVESSTIPKRRNRRRSKQIVKPEIRTIVETPVVTMADMRTMSVLLQAPTEGYGDAIVIPAILAENFKIFKIDSRHERNGYSLKDKNEAKTDKTEHENRKSNSHSEFDDEAITFKVSQTSRYSYNDAVNRLNEFDVIDIACEEYAQEVHGFSDSSTCGNPTPSLDHILSTFPPLSLLLRIR
ncbi:hypothetical protein Tco_1045212 [Tanacetum coccineum]|uniref:Reverse transcriptase domain-containing protein n=1 Tax=Tanacetum coccineum TaxID=301880 RepID=A0ABQ5GUA7_9ASTR